MRFTRITSIQLCKFAKNDLGGNFDILAIPTSFCLYVIELDFLEDITEGHYFCVFFTEQHQELHLSRRKILEFVYDNMFKISLVFVQNFWISAQYGQGKNNLVIKCIQVLLG